VTFYLVPLDTSLNLVPTPVAHEGQAFWLDSRTLAHVKTSSESPNQQELYAVSIEASNTALTKGDPFLVGKFPPATDAR
jgi:hypothetical protein